MISAHPLLSGLRHGLGQLPGVELDEERLVQLLKYLDLMQKWTKVYNLTALRDPAEMLTHHVLDSLAVVEPLRVQLTGVPEPERPWRLLDVGSGAGLPGVVLAICFPEMQVHCVDAVEKKAAFVRQVAASLKLSNLKGLHARVETVTDAYDVVCSRAFASLSDFTAWSSHVLGVDGIWLAMKGKVPTDEITMLPSDIQVFHVEHLDVPGLDARRCIVWMRKTSEVRSASAVF